MTQITYLLSIFQDTHAIDCLPSHYSYFNCLY